MQVGDDGRLDCRGLRHDRQPPWHAQYPGQGTVRVLIGYTPEARRPGSVRVHALCQHTRGRGGSSALKS